MIVRRHYLNRFIFIPSKHVMYDLVWYWGFWAFEKEHKEENEDTSI